MKIVALCLGVVVGVVALAIYIYSLKLRIKEITEKVEEKNRAETN